MKIPSSYKPRINAAAKEHGFPSADAFTRTLIERGLKALGATAADVPGQMTEIVESLGYSSEEELVEHLLERGLSAYESNEKDPEKLRARLRGLGYID